MADHGALFSGPMVRSILADLKTQTRRVIKPRGKRRPSIFSGGWSDSYILDAGNESWRQQDIPWKVGDRLWVRETWRTHGWHADCVEVAYAAQRGMVGWTEQHQQIRYPAGDRNAFKYYPPKGPDFWRPSLLMPRWASRITLLVKDVRVQRLRDISDEDAIAEGATCRPNCSGFGSQYSGWSMDWSDVGTFCKAFQRPLGESDVSLGDPVAAFANFINELHGGPHWNMKSPSLWDLNPWVVAYTFTSIFQNIDRISNG